MHLTSPALDRLTDDSAGRTDQALSHGQASTPQQQRLLSLCREFESFLLSHIFSTMREAMTTEGGLFGHSMQEDVYRSMFDQEVAKSVSESANVGIARLMFRQLSPLLGK